MPYVEMGILSGIFIVASVVEAKLFNPGLPMVSLATLLVLSFYLRKPKTLLLIAFIGGILKDGVYTEVFWISPLFFPLVALLGLFYRSYVNVSLFLPKLIMFSLVVIAYFGILIGFQSLDIGLLKLFQSVLFTVVLSLILDRLA